MKLFIVIYLAGKIGGTIGPLPYGMDECQSRTVEITANQCHDKPGNPYKCSDVKLICEYHLERPANDPTAGDRLKK